MCPEKVDVPVNPVFSSRDVTLRIPRDVVDGDAGDDQSMISEMKRLLTEQSNQIEKLSNLITKLDQSFQKLLSQTPPVAVSSHRHHSVGAEISRKSKFSLDAKLVNMKPDHSNENPQSSRIEDAAALGLGKPRNLVSDVSAIRQSQSQTGGSGPGGGMTIARYKPAWAEHFQFVSAVKVDIDVSCLHVLPHEGDDGMSRYVAVGDSAGRIFIFFIQGDLLVDYATLSQAPVTAMLSFTLRKNETWLVTGHADGAVLVHRIWEIMQRGSPSSEEVHQLVLEYVHSFVPPSSQDTGNYDLKAMFETGAELLVTEEVLGGVESKSKLITHLEMYRVGKMRYVLVADSNGKMEMFRENGTLFGVADSLSRPLAFLQTPNTQRLLFLTKTGGGSLDLRTMTVRTCPCDGLNGSTVVAYAFDAAGRSRAYGFKEKGDLVYVILSGDTLHFECHARTTKRKLDVEGPVSLHGITGYLVVATPKSVFVYNTTLQLGFSYANIRGGAGHRPLFSASLDDISLSFLPTPIAAGKLPMMACNRDKLIVVGFGGGYVGIYRSTLPVHKLPDFNAKFWSSPIFVSVILLLLAWQLLSRKRDPAPTDSSKLVMQIAPNSTASGFGYRENLDGAGSLKSRNRYESPSRSYSTKPVAYGQSSMNYRSTAADPSYSTRREPLFANQTVGDLRH
ncbi:uncharacterized membrane protein At1g75140 [Physcomitrium patens]|uniref:Uncharacterized protein n=1 Tax=Physcomitrium patens TaxID=3218 RepID=A0A2K1K080_PHYPA|nr:uncharacterized membrane protein At1g75140-like [Physcomitrium patens]XP_024387266.1 uncharacterized membrane protein At1g75140-like [Physcomitrium patens]PNR47184.1 hypothetical protein PHYPA_014304 [Physcomitrium patens]|eukprot:XP_024387265.1 uncharacterized membrane protein At1g75140-like [Physcomitrella patens]